jgi:replicative DNA helicase
VCARPANGKTTLFANQIIHAANDPQQKVLCFPLETSPGKFRITLAAIEEGLNPGLVRRREWESLPPGAKNRVAKRMGIQSARWGNRLRMVGDDRISQAELLRWLKHAHKEKYTLVALDHLHEVAWTDNPDKLTAEMTEGMHKIRVLLREYESTESPLRFLAACQLKRPTGYDPLEEYMVPPLSAIKQSGAAEEVAAYVYMLYRALKEGVTEGDMKLVRAGQMPVSEVADIGTTKLNCAKHRDDGGLKGQEIKMYIQEDRLLDEKPTHGWMPVNAAAHSQEVI